MQELSVILRDAAMKNLQSLPRRGYTTINLSPAGDT